MTKTKTSILLGLLALATVAGLLGWPRIYDRWALERSREIASFVQALEVSHEPMAQVERVLGPPDDRDSDDAVWLYYLPKPWAYRDRGTGGGQFFAIHFNPSTKCVESVSLINYSSLVESAAESAAVVTSPQTVDATHLPSPPPIPGCKP